MNVLIIGATRGIGLQLLEQALMAGHGVTVLVRDPQKLKKDDADLHVIKGDILDLSAVEQAMAGQEAACCCIGVRPTRKPVAVFSQGVQNVLQAMEKTGVKRLISITGIGAGDSRGHGGFFYDRIFNPLFLKTIYEDKDREEAAIKASQVDWLIVRPGFLTNGPMRGRYRILTDLTGVKAGKISRADVAHFILEQLASSGYIKQTPLLTY